MGRFAPSPTGDLHLGSLYAAAASYLDARAHGGRWLIRLEDLDRPRERPGAAARILRTLEAFGFEWDGEVVRQSDRGPLYAAALDALRRAGRTFECSCSRLDLADAPRYPGSCRSGPLRRGRPTAVRLRVEPGIVRFTDRIQGPGARDVAATAGDLVIRRRDGIVSYLLAVVVDDAAQGVTDVVRGADLIEHTPAQRHLQELLGLPAPRYAHVPVLTEPDGAKLAKSARSLALDAREPQGPLLRALDLLGLPVGEQPLPAGLPEIWDWAIRRWDPERVPKRPALPVRG